eukprot:4427951-Ditylum_brightwellii.AAC.1
MCHSILEHMLAPGMSTVYDDDKSHQSLSNISSTSFHDEESPPHCQQPTCQETNVPTLETASPPSRGADQTTGANSTEAPVPATEVPVHASVHSAEALPYTEAQMPASP